MHECGYTSIGMTEIKRRRLVDIQVPCHPDTKVGDYVPFYFCPRSIMLYILHMGNHPDLTHYRSGQEPILHLQADVHTVINWADRQGVRWAFSDRNAGSHYAEFHKDFRLLDRIDWAAVKSNDFRHPLVKEGKQAEFLIHGTCPWHLIEKIGVIKGTIRMAVNTLVENIRHQPELTVERAWYY